MNCLHIFRSSHHRSFKVRGRFWSAYFGRNVSPCEFTVFHGSWQNIFCQAYLRHVNGLLSGSAKRPAD